MKDRSWPDGERPVPAWLQSEMDDVFAGATILLVEDDADIRELLVTLLTLAGFTPTACGTAEQALQQLREQAFDLVLTDYALPNRTGGWLLRQASEEGLLEATPAMVVTAHPSPADVNGFEIIQKPFDLDQLVERVRQRLESGNPMRPRPRPGQGLPSGKSQNGHDGRGEPIELILYVSAHSARSATAIRNIRRALEACKGKVTLTICDLSKDPGGGEQDSVAFTPTLVKRSPGPRTFILGHITSPELLLELLDGCDPD